MNEELKKEIRHLALQDAILHEGQTRDKIILGRFLGTNSEFRTKVKEISGDISEIVEAVNQMSLEEQEKEVESKTLEYNRKIDDKFGV